MGVKKSGVKGGSKKATGIDDMKEQCDECPLKTGKIPVIAKGLEMNSKRLCTIENRCDDRRKECVPVISSKVSLKVFWPVVIIFTAITGGMITFISTSNASSQRDHNEIHKELNNEIKQMNHNIYQEIRTISEDVKVIKARIENGGG